MASYDGPQILASLILQTAGQRVFMPLVCARGIWRIYNENPNEREIAGM